jgi:hypothetical protein
LIILSLIRLDNNQTLTPSASIAATNDDYNGYATLEPPDDKLPHSTFMLDKPGGEPGGGKTQEKRKHQVCDHLSFQSKALMLIIQSEN